MTPHQTDAQVAADAAEIDAINAVREAWTKQHHELASGPVNKDGVFTVCWKLIEANVQPTGENVRYVLGKGSNSTVFPLIKAYFRGELKRNLASPPSDIPANDGFQKAWNIALTEAQAAVEEGFKKRNARLDAREAAIERELEARVADIEAKLAAKEWEIAKREAECNESLAAADVAISQADHRAHDAKKDLDKVTTSLTDLRNRLAAEIRFRRSDSLALAVSAKHVERLQLESGSMADALRETQSRSATLQSDVKALTEIVSRRDADMIALNARIENLTAELATAHARVAELIDAQTVSTRELVKTRKALDAAVEDRDALHKRAIEALAAETLHAAALSVAQARIVDLERARREMDSILVMERERFTELQQAMATDSAHWRELIRTLPASGQA